jgi:hypothetical protein
MFDERDVIVERNGFGGRTEIIEEIRGPFGGRTEIVEERDGFW